MSGFISKRYAHQEEFQEGEVPDDVLDQTIPDQRKSTEIVADEKKIALEEDQFIFQTVPDHELDDKYNQRDKQNYRTHEHYSSSNQSNQKKDWERNDRQRNFEKSSKVSQKKDFQPAQSKPKNQIQEEIRPQIPGNVGYYPNMALPNNPYSAPPAAYYPGYVISQPGIIARSPYGIYPPQPLHQLPPTMFAPSAQVPYQIPNLYQIPATSMPYSPQVGQQVNQMYRTDRNPQQLRQNKEHNSNIQYEQYQSSSKKQMAYGSSNKQQHSSRPLSNRQRGNDYKQKSFDEQRERSRERRDNYEYQPSKNDKRYEKNFEKTCAYDSYKERSKQIGSQSYAQNDRKAYRQQKKINQQFQDQKLFSKKYIFENTKLIFADNIDEKEEFFFILRDILKFKLLKKEEEDILSSNDSQSFESSKKTQFYSLNKDLICSNYDKALLKLQKLIIQSDKSNEESQGNLSKRSALLNILSSLQLADLVSSIKQMRLKKKLIGQKKMSQIKKLLEELVKDPRKRVK